MIEEKLQKVSENIRHANIHQGWRIMKDIIVDTAVEVCGVTRINNKRKQMVCWTDEIKEQIRRKKTEWKKYTANNCG